ncbi:MAG: hypothetical protein ABJB12_17625 [Pseudomonadota bacterium]
MPDSIRCSVDASQAHHTVTCEVDIGPEPSVSAPSSAQPSAAPSAAPPAVASPPAAPPPAAPPAVTALVNRFLQSRHEVHAPPVDKVTVDSAKGCLGALIGVPLLAAKMPPVAVLSAFKVGYDLGACLGKSTASRQVTADEAAQVKDCESDGGIPSGFIGKALMCFEPSAVTK